MDFGSFKERLCLDDLAKRIDSHLQHLLNLCAQLAINVYQEQIRDCQAEDSKSSVEFWVMALDRKQTFTVQDENLTYLLVICSDIHRVEALGASTSAHMEL